MGRANAGKRKISEIEVDRFQELIKDVPEEELHAALEDSDIEGEKVLSTDSEERFGEDDDQMTESTQDESYSQESEPTTEELSDDAHNDEVPTDVIDMCQQKLIDE